MSETFRNDPPLPAGAKLCTYGRYGRIGRAVRDAWQNLANPIVAVLLVLAVALFTAVVFVSSPKTGDGERILIALADVVASLIVVILLGAAFALTPWGRRTHWKNRFHPFTAAGPFGGKGCSLVSQHWHVITAIGCDVARPDGSHQKIAYPSHNQFENMDGLKTLCAPDEKLHTINDGTWALRPIPGKYRVRWNVQIDGTRKPIIVAKGTYNNERP
jgi:hypothetical protein